MAKTIEQFNKLSLPVKLGIVAGGYFLILKPLLKGITNPAPPPANQTPTSAQNEVDNLINNGQQLSHPLSWYAAKADAMQQAMFDLGTDEAVIYGAFNGCNSIIDVLQLISTFGNRPYYYFGINYGNLTLPQWFSEELDSSEIDQINTILQNKNINYYF